MANPFEVRVGVNLFTIATSGGIETSIGAVNTAHAASHTDGTDDVADLVGDSGSGGTHGLASAPAAGDAAKGFMYHTDGTRRGLFEEWLSGGGGDTAMIGDYQRRWITEHQGLRTVGTSGGHTLSGSQSAQTGDGSKFRRIAATTGTSAAFYQNALAHRHHYGSIVGWKLKIATDDADDASFLYWLTDQDSILSGPNPAGRGIGFRWWQGTDTNIQAFSKDNVLTDGSDTTLVDTGIAPDAGIHYYGMDLRTSTSSVVFKIDDQVVGTITTKLNTTARDVGFQFHAFADGAGTINMDFYRYEFLTK